MNGAPQTQHQAEAELRAALAGGQAAVDAISTLHIRRGVPVMILTRAVAAVFGLPLNESRRVVLDILGGKAYPDGDAEPMFDSAAWWHDWCREQVRVLEVLERHSPLWQAQPRRPAIYRGYYFPAFDDFLMLSVELEPNPILRAVAVEMFGPTQEPTRVSVYRWPVPIALETELRHWSVQAELSDQVLPLLHRAAAPLLRETEVHNQAGGVDGLAVVGSIQDGARLIRLAGWTLSRQNRPDLHAFFGQLLQVALDVLPAGRVHSAAKVISGYLSDEGKQRLQR